MAANTTADRCATFKETATLLEVAPSEVWSRIDASLLMTAPHGRYFSTAEFREFIELNQKLFGPGKQEL